MERDLNRIVLQFSVFHSLMSFLGVRMHCKIVFIFGLRHDLPSKSSQTRRSLIGLQKLDSYWSTEHGDDKTNKAIVFRCHRYK